ncbi:hypothetical protein [Polaribacter butkevichii]|uniref:Uncharacterized protein n=1 Tax=Polaribacter butkevichii TaxID=218490 RepID=A0A2P6CBQ8_9FLAO|nr:hypothetical protein [Polaribacter butkevichii]PQJ72319.1 hypothetical protein BTO14_03230 [Polaribacter butkevichii]
MKKVCLVFAILLANSVFTSCTDLDENLENEPVKSEILVTVGEDGQDPDEGDDEEEGDILVKN